SQTHGSTRLGIIQFEQHVAFFHILPVAGGDLGYHAFRACSQLHGVNRLDAARDLALSSVGSLFHGGNANRNGGGKGRWQGEGEQCEQEWEFHGSTSGLLPSPRPSPNGRGRSGS